jgi:glycosyltransferase involved in cell wall biosynthesis
VLLTALVEHPDHVCCRYRLSAFRPYLEQAGHALQVRALPRRPWARWRLFRSLRGASVLLQRRLLPRWDLAFLRRQARHLLFDFDDAVFLRDSYSPKGLRHPRRLRAFAATVRACDAILAGNPFLFDHAARWAGVQRVHLVPTCVDPTRYPAGRAGPARDRLRLVWVGSSSTLQGLKRAAPLLEELGRRVPGLELKLICDSFLELAHLPVIPCRWSPATESAEIADADVGITWVPEDDWSRGKCGLKVLQYLAAGLPVVANLVGVHPEMVRHGETGYLARTPGQWVEAVGRLARSPGLRARMGRQGRQLLEARYSVGVGARAWLGVLAGLEGPLRRAS